MDYGDSYNKIVSKLLFRVLENESVTETGVVRIVKKAVKKTRAIPVQNRTRCIDEILDCIFVGRFVLKKQTKYKIGPIGKRFLKYDIGGGLTYRIFKDPRKN